MDLACPECGLSFKSITQHGRRKQQSLLKAQNHVSEAKLKEESRTGHINVRRRWESVCRQHEIGQVASVEKDSREEELSDAPQETQLVLDSLQ